MKAIPNTRIILEAIEFAKDAHKGQVRKVTGEDYYLHPVTVAFLVLAFKRSKRITDLLVAAILHDVLEDTDKTFEEVARKFGPFVASLVLELTNDLNEIKRIGKTAYMKAKFVKMSSYGLLIKLCDRLHNMSDQPSKKEKRNTLEIMGHLIAERRNLTRAQLELAEFIILACRK
jgi:GTP pyrophosphokinase